MNDESDLGERAEVEDTRVGRDSNHPLADIDRATVGEFSDQLSRGRTNSALI